MVKLKLNENKAKVINYKHRLFNFFKNQFSNNSKNANFKKPDFGIESDLKTS